MKSNVPAFQQPDLGLCPHYDRQVLTIFSSRHQSTQSCRGRWGWSEILRLYMTLDFRPKKSDVSSESSPAGRRPHNWLEKQPINPTFDATVLLSLIALDARHLSFAGV